MRGAADERRDEAVSPEFLESDGMVCKAEHHHKNKRMQNLRLVFSRMSQMEIESGKISHGRISSSRLGISRTVPNSCWNLVHCEESGCAFISCRKFRYS